ncbi:MAG: VanZ family protein [Gemmatimonadota bacterium]
MSARAYVPGVAWALGLLALGSWSGAPGPSTDLPLDKAAHLALYGVLGVLTGLGWLWAHWPRRALIPLCLALLVGPMDELNQRSVPGRSAEWGDLVADTAGVLAGFALSVRRRRMLPTADDHDD